ncbi:MAG: multifunctional CCA tRNA nucleotidyl transferase/2'3'-cyclic phosphodiesterase/2'nucleotidase/phosphatase [Halobacteriovoraceae bacterium]|jgi:tRNA nucleotidyltransferase (CCA-adding enzyme)|nr:multifunctional CCA tRNA nucleotidyl transferase/2'3'-cyclic phosphodiesterase/2'nucleotidase/phosphatase [Halobacteriovoraceae bacterium]
MKIYLVGGAVRDEILGLAGNDRDYVVVGSNEKEMLSLGYIKVGKDFPVFLHPLTKEEYALARMEKKIGKGYHGFEFDCINVTLEQDLARRDLTINAIAKDLDSNTLIDPFNGIKDLENKVLRHTSQHFKEDPLRILRIARFSAKFPQFSIHNETIHLIKDMIQTGELSSLSAPRVWQEIEKSLATSEPANFFTFLRSIDAYKYILTGLQSLDDNQWEISLATLKRSCSLSSNTNIRFASMTYLIEDIKRTCNQLTLPKDTKNLCLKVIQLHKKIHLVKRIETNEVLELVKEMGGLKKTNEFNNILIVYQSINHLDAKYNIELLLKIQNGLSSIDNKATLKGIKSSAIKKAIHSKQLSVVNDIINKE